MWPLCEIPLKKRQFTRITTAAWKRLFRCTKFILSQVQLDWKNYIDFFYFFITSILWIWGVGGYLESNPFIVIEFLSREIIPRYHTSRYGTVKPLGAVQDATASRFNWVPIEGHPYTPWRQSAVMSDGFHGDIDWVPMMPKDTLDFLVAVSPHIKKSYRNHIVLTIFRLIWSQTDVH